MTQLAYLRICLLALAMSLPGCNLPSAQPATPLGAATASTGSERTPEACKNDYYPVVQGASWAYSMSGGVTDTYTRSITAVKPDGFTEQTRFGSGVTTASEWECDDGGLTTLQPAVGPSATVQWTAGLKANSRTTDYSGVTVPDNIGPGATWNQETTIEGTETLNGQDAQAKNVIKMDCTGDTEETVNVPAGKFNALRADCRIEENVTVTTAGSQVPTNLSSTATLWYASGVGLVKIAEVIGGIPPVTIELTSYKIP